MLNFLWKPNCRECNTSCFEFRCVFVNCSVEIQFSYHSSNILLLICLKIQYEHLYTECLISFTARASKSTSQHLLFLCLCFCFVLRQGLAS
jgi:hypothetical protein